jgi:hypothetical protein
MWKVPTNEKFSSESYLACIEIELPTGQTTQELQNKIHDTFCLVKQAVEDEIAGSIAQGASDKQTRPDTPSRAPAQDQTATNKQIGFILKLGNDQQKGLPELNAMAQLQFKAESIYQLTKRDASALVDKLKLAA